MQFEDWQSQDTSPIRACSKGIAFSSGQPTPGVELAMTWMTQVFTRLCYKPTNSLFSLNEFTCCKQKSIQFIQEIF